MSFREGIDRKKEKHTTNINKELVHNKPMILTRKL
jgi:hypothetical protein